MSQEDRIGFKQKLGCWLYERWRAECALRPWLSSITGIRWEDLRNRGEVLEEGAAAGARVCRREWTTSLTVARFFPRVGGRLASRAFADWPLQGEHPAPARGDAAPSLSVILPVGGRERLPLFRAVLDSFAKQSVSNVEVIVVEHSADAAYDEGLPPGAIYRHLPLAAGEEFNKSRLANIGVRCATAEWILLHDADIVVPHRYVESLLGAVREGYEAVLPIRLLFYLDADATVSFLPAKALPAGLRVKQVSQNFPGASIAVRKDVYEALGGHNERFQGWGGEDSEFLSRLKTRRVFRGGFMPALHLWHALAPKKASGHRNQELLDRELAIPPAERIRQSRSLAGPA